MRRRGPGTKRDEDDVDEDDDERPRRRVENDPYESPIFAPPVIERGDDE